MKKQINEQSNKPHLLTGICGEATPTKVSGLAFSLASILPVLIAFIFLIVLIALGQYHENMESHDWYLYCNFLIPQTAFAIIAFVLLRYTQKPLKTRIQEQKCEPKYFAIAILMQIGLFILSALNQTFLSFLQKHGYNGAEVLIPSLDGVGYFGCLLVIAILPAIFEEILFRGILLNGLKNAFSETKAILLCGALFSLYHQNPAQTLYQFVCGVAFAFIALRAGSIVPTVVAHFLNNTFIITAQKYPMVWVSSTWFAYLSAVSLVTAVVWLFFCKKESAGKSEENSKRTFFLFASVGIIVCAVSWITVLLG